MFWFKTIAKLKKELKRLEACTDKHRGEMLVLKELTKNDSTAEVHLRGDIGECKKCGCLLYKNNSYKVSTIKTEIVEPTFGDKDRLCMGQEYLHHDYYCKLHAPKKRK